MNNKQVQTTETPYMPRMTAKVIKIIMHAFTLSWDLLYDTGKWKSDLKSDGVVVESMHVSL